MNSLVLILIPISHWTFASCTRLCEASEYVAQPQLPTCCKVMSDPDAKSKLLSSLSCHNWGLFLDWLAPRIEADVATLLGESPGIERR